MQEILFEIDNHYRFCDFPVFANISEYDYLVS